ncbi:MAG: EamA family transporter [Candidatus Vogelbacteria bacterium]|nr:EamA family transporter [Candidatus Vogelbacteria bacterium]
MIWVIPLLVLVLFELIADIFAKEWSLRNYPWLLAVAALLGYLLANTSWLFALRYGSGLARGAIVFSVASAILAILVGLLFYKEQLSLIQIAGAALGIIALVLIFWE